jgi:hypothetical protein
MNKTIAKWISPYDGLVRFVVRNPMSLIRAINRRNIRDLMMFLGREPLALTARRLERGIVYYASQQKTSDPGRSNSSFEKNIIALERKYPGITEPTAIGNAIILENKLAPIPFRVHQGEPVRVNLLLPQLDPLIIFGGYVACLQFIRALVQANYRVRIVICEDQEFDCRAFLDKFKADGLLYDTLVKCEYVNATTKRSKLPISPKDSFICYSFWTGLLAHQLAKAIGKKFVFFIQEYEPIFHPFDSYHAIGAYVYSLPHYAVFNTEILRDWFREERIGIFATGDSAGLENSAWYQHALTKTSPPGLGELAERKTRRLLFYGRPEAHAKRNLFEIGYLGLRQAVELGYFEEGAWEFVGVGTLGTEHELPLGKGKVIRLLSKMPLMDYAEALRGFDVGLSLMYAPHPSILPFEMAASGIITVTNTFGRRNVDFFRSVSTNIEPCQPNIDAISQALGTAVARVADYTSRLQGARITWVSDWRESFNNRFLSEIAPFLS